MLLVSLDVFLDVLLSGEEREKGGGGGVYGIKFASRRAKIHAFGTLYLCERRAGISQSKKA